MTTPAVDRSEYPAPERPMRADALRNRARILDGAAELFALKGLGVTLNDIAHHTGVGVGTVYRHFPDKDELIETLFQTRVDEMVANATAGLADPDPWHGFVTTMEANLELQAANRGLRELIHDSPEGLAQIVRVRERLLPLGAELLRRAQAIGAIRPDISHTDIPILQLMIVTVVDASRDIDPDLWRRYLALQLRSLSPHPDDLAPLPEHIVGTETIDRVLQAAAPPRRG